MKVIGTVGEPRSTRNGWSQILGDFVEYTWHGTPEFVRTTFALLRGNCAEADCEIEGQSGIVRARYASSTDQGGEEQLRVDIRLARNDVQKSIFEPGPDGYYADITQEEIRNIKALLDDPLDEEAFAFMQDASQNAQDLYDVANAGVEYRIVSQPVITQITTASSLFYWPNQSANAGLIFSQATMLDTLRDAPNFTVPSATDAAPDGFNYGWRLATPTYETSSDGHSSEILEFEFGLWPVFLFGSPI